MSTVPLAATTALVPATTAALAAACCVLLLVRPARAGVARLSPSPHAGPARRPGWSGVRRGLPVLLVVLGATLLTARPAVLLLALGGVVLLWTGVVLRRRSRTRQAAERRRAAVAEACDALVAALAAGAPAVTALSEVAREQPECAPVARTAGLGGDVAAAWRSLASLPGATDLQHVASAWQLATRTGAPLAGTLARVAGSLRDANEARVEVEAALGPPRATARLLAVLPLLGLGLGAGLGGDPLEVLTSSVPVAACVLAGLVLAALGVVWVERVAETAAQE